MPQTDDRCAMTLIHPSTLLDLHQSLDVHQNCLPVVILGVQQEQLHTVEDLAVGRSVEDEGDLACAFIQVVEGFLVGMNSTPG